MTVVYISEHYATVSVWPFGWGLPLRIPVGAGGCDCDNYHVNDDVTTPLHALAWVLLRRYRILAGISKFKKFGAGWSYVNTLTVILYLQMPARAV